MASERSTSFPATAAPRPERRAEEVAPVPDAVRRPLAAISVQGTLPQQCPQKQPQRQPVVGKENVIFGSGSTIKSSRNDSGEALVRQRLEDHRWQVMGSHYVEKTEEMTGVTAWTLTAPVNMQRQQAMAS